MPHRTFPGALFALALVASGCTSAVSSSPGANDAGVDADAPIADAPIADAPVPTAGPIDGTWRVTEIACNGAPASGAARLYITAPNSSSFVVNGNASTYTLTTAACALRLESTVAYPSPGRAVFTATGPFTCVPAACLPTCGTTPGIPYVYEYDRRDPALVMTSVGATPDVTCTAAAQSNPITYTYARM